MCGILAVLLANPNEFVNQMLVDGLTVLQHRGQDAAGIVTSEQGGRLHLRKDNGLVKDVFQDHHMLELSGNVGLGHVRYPTAGSSSCAEAQPLYTNYPYGICVAHNGNLINTESLSQELKSTQRHINTDSDSELLLNVFAEEITAKRLALQKKGENNKHTVDTVELVFQAMEGVMTKCKGGYAGLYLINGIGLVGFRDPHGIRPIVFGSRRSLTCGSLGISSYSSIAHVSQKGFIPSTPSKMNGGLNTPLDYCMASESVAIDTLGFQLVRDIRAGEAIFVDMKTGECHARICHPSVRLAPCIFEYVYFARPDSIMDGVSVYESRLAMGEKLANKIMTIYPDHDIDVVIPIPDTSRTSALQAAYILGRPFREGFIKNRYIARTFIMPGQATRKKSVRLKLNTIKSEFAGRNVLLVDDSIVRGTTAKEIVDMAREAGAVKVYFASAAPAIRFPNIYGIDIPTRNELVAYGRDESEIAKHIGCDWIVYQNTEDLEDAVRSHCSTELYLTDFDTSCFTGKYITGETINDKYFQKLHDRRNDSAQELRRRGSALEPVPSFPHSSIQGDGCESVHNDIRDAKDDGKRGCEGI